MRRLAGTFAASILVHAAIAGGALGFIAWRDAQAGPIEIDLSGSSLLSRPAHDGGRSRPPQPPQPWVLASGQRFAPPPKAEPLSQTAQVEEEASPCPAPCPESEGDWVPAHALKRRPSWVSGHITEADYPRALRRQGQRNKVVVDVLIDAQGAVHGVNLVHSTEAQLVPVILDRLKRSRFKPAYNADGRAVACRLRMPIQFHY